MGNGEGGRGKREEGLLSPLGCEWGGENFICGFYTGDFGGRKDRDMRIEQLIEQTG